MDIKKIAFFLLRLGLGITFLWIGILIVQNPAGWAGSVKGWVSALLPLPLEKVMFGNGIFDIAVGAWLILGWKPYISGIFASLHLILVLVATGPNPITIRDIGLLGASLFLTLYFWPLKDRMKI